MTEHETAPPTERPRLRLDEARVIETLDSEMSRLEQAVTRSGWTVWAGTATLGALAWLFISIIPSDQRFWLPWDLIVIIAALLSFFQDLWEALRVRLIPNLERALNQGGQYRVLLTQEALPFERASHAFTALRSALLLLSSGLLYPVVGVLVWAPILLHSYVFLKMCRYLWLNLKSRLASRRSKADRLFLLGAAASAATAVYGFTKIDPTAGATGLLALKGASLIVGAAYVIDWMATPRVELPLLERIREIRRQLGFGQIAADEAVTRCEIALFGHPSAQFIESNLAELSSLKRTVSESLSQILEHLEISDKILTTITSDASPSRELFTQTGSIAEQAFTIGLELFGHIKTFHADRARIDKIIQGLRDTTHNDTSLPLCEKDMKSIVEQFRGVCKDFETAFCRLKGGIQILGESASKHSVRLPDHVTLRVPIIETMLARITVGGDLAIAD